MISNVDTTRLISNLGWVDGGNLWCLDTATRRIRKIELSDAAYLELREGDREHFTAVHHYDGASLWVTVQPYADPGRTLAAIEVRGWVPTTSGDLSLFAGLDRNHVGYLNDSATGAAGYYLIHVTADRVEVSRLDWFDDNGYDHMYQGIVSVVETPETNELVFGVARSSDVVICQPATLRVSRQLRLPGNMGNPTLFLRRYTSELWTINYDTVVRIDSSTWEVTGTFQGQQPIGGTRMFLGSMWFTPDRGSVLVARPGSADAILLRTSDLAAVAHFPTGGEPLEAALLPDGTVAARAWKSGDLLVGTRRD